jgi:hypothetical protein
MRMLDRYVLAAVSRLAPKDGNGSRVRCPNSLRAAELYFIKVPPYLNLQRLVWWD